MAQQGKRNYQRELDELLGHLAVDTDEAHVPTLFLHSCCAPCSSYVLEYLSQYFQITDFFFNPNIWPEEEYRYRSKELQGLIEKMPLRHPVTFREGPYDPELFLETVRGLEDIPEGGKRCFACYELRMRQAARMAAEEGFDYFTTTLSISPLKNAQKINEIGDALAKQYGVAHLPSDFKKKGGYQRSVELSARYGLYRQDYCGCIFSKRESEERRRKKSEEAGGKAANDKADNNLTACNA